MELIVYLVDHEFFDDTRGFEGRGASFRLDCFGVDGVNIFQGFKSRIIVQN
jgi:hypothetical protein